MSTIPLEQTLETPLARSLRKLLETSTDPMLLLDRSLRVACANSEARMRFSDSSLGTGQSFEDFLALAFPEADTAGVTEALTAMLEREDPEPARLFLDEGDKQVHLVATALEGTEAEATSLALAITLSDPNAETHLRHLEFVMDASTDGIFIFNKANKIVYFNSACEKMTGWKRGAAFETHECSNVLRCHNEAGESMSSEALCPAKIFFHRDSVPVPHEMLITTKGGKERWVETNYSPIKNASGDVEFVVGIIRDIDERKRLESQLVQAKNLASLGQLISGIAHEIKNPLGIIMSSVEVLTNEERPASQRNEAAIYLKEEVRRLDDRVKDFLAFAKPKPLLVDEVNINALVKKTVLSYSSLSSGRFRMKTELARKAPMVLGDPDLLHQVFLNLIINADQAMRFGGVLEVTTEVMEDAVRVKFSDQGQGIPSENIVRIFDPFFTTKKDGTGLGLSIVAQILTSHKATYHVANNDGEPGVTFEIVFPLKRKAQL